MDIDTYRAHGLERSLVDGELTGVINGRSFFEDIATAMGAAGDTQYAPCPEAFPAADVRRGTIEHLPAWHSIGHYPGTARDVWIYASAGVTDATDAPGLMVFNDGGWYLAPDGPIRVPAVVDSLVHSGELGPTVAVFVAAGVPDGAEGGMGDLATFRQRSVEYDTCDGQFAAFLEDEILPVAEEHAGRSFTSDPSRRMISGISSGGICAFNAAWHRPESFGLVLSHCGSFTALRGGHHYPYLVRSTDRKPIKVFLQSGEHDLDTIFGNWPLANREMAAALEYAGYDHRFEFGGGGHSLNHGGALFADSIRWLTSARG